MMIMALTLTLLAAIVDVFAPLPAGESEQSILTKIMVWTQFYNDESERSRFAQSRVSTLMSLIGPRKLVTASMFIEMLVTEQL